MLNEVFRSFSESSRQMLRQNPKGRPFSYTPSPNSLCTTHIPFNTVYSGLLMTLLNSLQTKKYLELS
jgi:hypothetical protein